MIDRTIIFHHKSSQFSHSSAEFLDVRNAKTKTHNQIVIASVFAFRTVNSAKMPLDLALELQVLKMSILRSKSCTQTARMGRNIPIQSNHEAGRGSRSK
jgi:hypothetical protein